MRRLPLIIVADCSGSMQGESIEALNHGLKAFTESLFDAPETVETAWVSLITFGDEAHLAYPLTELAEFAPPVLEANGLSAFGGALDLVEKVINSDVRKGDTETGELADIRPVVIVLTDGLPTDEWEETAARLKRKDEATFIVLACGHDADVASLYTLTDARYYMESVNPSALLEFFNILSRSVRQNSVRASSISSSVMNMGLPSDMPDDIEVFIGR